MEEGGKKEKIRLIFEKEGKGRSQGITNDGAFTAAPNETIPMPRTPAYRSKLIKYVETWKKKKGGEPETRIRGPWKDKARPRGKRLKNTYSRH